MKIIGIFLMSILCFLNSSAQTKDYNLINLNQMNQRNTIELAQNSNFRHGVASGDPLQDAIIIWTRISNVLNGSIIVNYKMALDTAMTYIIADNIVTTDENADYTIKVDVTGLDPGTTYYYQFEYNGNFSQIGRTKTASDMENHLRFAVVSCSNYQAGYFNAYRSISKKADLDAVIHLGDYFYEYEEGGYGYDSLLMRGHDPDHEIISLMDYRTRYSFYRSDPDLQQVHQQHPFICIWDDHEFANDAYIDGAQNHQADEGDWEIRKAASKKAFFEWLPIRNDPNEKIHRSFSFGDLMKLTMIDTRMQGRQIQLTPSDSIQINDENRTLLGTEQLDWFKNELLNNNSQWHIIGNQVIFSTSELGTLIDLNPAAETIFMDSWEGYPEERNSLINFVDSNELNNIVICTGDFHTALAFDITLDPFDPNAYNPSTGAGSQMIEMVVPSVTSPNFDEIIGALTAVVEGLFPSNNPHNKYGNYRDHGHCILDVNEDSVSVDYFYTSDLKQITDDVIYGGTVSSQNNNNHWIYGQIASSPKANASDLAPVSVFESESAGIGFDILNLFPNPVNNINYINFSNQNYQLLYIDVYSINGKFINRIVNQRIDKGFNTIAIDLSELISGNYFYSFILDNNFTKTVPFTKIK